MLFWLLLFLLLLLVVVLGVLELPPPPVNFSFALRVVLGGYVLGLVTRGAGYAAGLQSSGIIEFMRTCDDGEGGNLDN